MRGHMWTPNSRKHSSAKLQVQLHRREDVKIVELVGQWLIFLIRFSIRILPRDESVVSTREPVSPLV